MSESTSSSVKPTFPPLNKNNFGGWKGNMKAYLMALGYWRIVSGKELKPSSPATADEIKSTYFTIRRVPPHRLGTVNAE